MTPPDPKTVMESLAEQLDWVLDEIDQGHLQADEADRRRLQTVLDELDRVSHAQPGRDAPARSPGHDLSSSG